MGFKDFIRGALNTPGEDDEIRYFGIKERVSGYILTSAQRNIPTPGYTYNVDITKFWEEFKNLKKSCGFEISFNTLMMRVLVEGLKAAPKLNSHLEFKFTSSCGRLIIKKNIDIAMPVFMENGDTFPIKVRNAESKNLRELSEQVADLISRLKNTDVNKVLVDIAAQRFVGFMLKGKIIPTVAQTITSYVGKYRIRKDGKAKVKKGPSLKTNELNEGTVCLTNWGPLYDGLNGSVTFTPLLYPQVFLMAMGNVRDEEYAFKNDDGVVDLATRKVLPITLLFDHRIGGFADVMPFIKKLDEIFENPEVIKEW